MLTQYFNARLIKSFKIFLKKLRLTCLFGHILLGQHDTNMKSDANIYVYIYGMY